MQGLVQVLLGVLLYNESKLDEMGKILEHYTLVSTLQSVQKIIIPNGSVIKVDNTQFHPIINIFGGDQLTVRIHGTKVQRDTHDTPSEHFKGVVVVVEDWHARIALLKVGEGNDIA